MEGTYQLLIRKAYSDIPGAFIQWVADSCASYLIAQHDADEEVTSTHCHMSIKDLRVTNKAMDKQREKHGLNGSASRLMSRCVETREPYDEEKLNIYILKGNIELLKKTSHSDADVARWADAWRPKVALLDPIRGGGKKPPLPYDEYDVMKKDFVKYYNDLSCPHISLDLMRTWTMRWYWKRDGRMPPATSYKRNAASLYVLATEMSNGSIETAFEELKELWY